MSGSTSKKEWNVFPVPVGPSANACNWESYDTCIINVGIFDAIQD